MSLDPHNPMKRGILAVEAEGVGGCRTGPEKPFPMCPLVSFSFYPADVLRIHWMNEDICVYLSDSHILQRRTRYQ